MTNKKLSVIVVVVAVLAAIVLINVSSYINKNQNTAIKATMTAVLKEGAMYFDKNLNYVGLCNTYFVSGKAVYNTINKANGGRGVTCGVNTADTAWCACSVMNIANPAEPTGSTICIDSTGYKKVTQNTVLCGRCSSGVGGGVCSD